MYILIYAFCVAADMCDILNDMLGTNYDPEFTTDEEISKIWAAQFPGPNENSQGVQTWQVST